MMIVGHQNACLNKHCQPEKTLGAGWLTGFKKGLQKEEEIHL